MIYISTSKTCARCTFSPLFVLNTIHMRFSIILSYPLKHFYAEWLAPPQKEHCVWTRFAISLFLPELELLPRFKYSAFRDEIDKYFCQYNFPFFSTLSGLLLSLHYIFHIGESYPRKFVWTDPKNNCFPLKLINPVRFWIYWCNSLLTPLPYVLLSGKAYHI